jgi:Domain of unknown function (DUF4336)
VLVRSLLLVASWDFQQIISCHFDSLIKANPRQFRQAFAFLEKNLSSSESQPLLEEDLKFIKELEAGLVKRGIATPAKEKL